MNKYLEYKDSYYKINLTKLFNFLSLNDSDSKKKTKSFVEQYGFPVNPTTDEMSEDFQLISKESSEIIEDVNESFSNLKYDVLKELFNNVNNISNKNDITFGNVLAFNTLLDKGIIEEIKNVK